ncbi:MAG: ABC transporter substrate-binding protein [Candidatus Bathyarchaeales archaeon]
MRTKKAMTLTQTILLIISLVVAFVVGVVVDRYVISPPSAQAQSLVYACWGGDFGNLTKRIADNYTRDFGTQILLEIHAGASSTVINKIESIWPEVKIDLAAVAPSVAVQLAKAGYLAELNRNDLPVLDQIPDNLLIKYNGKIYGIGLYVISVVSCAWRSDLITTPIANWTDLFKPEFNKKIATSHISLGTGDSVIMPAYWFGGSEYNLTAGWDALKQIAPRMSGIWTTETECINMLASGTAHIGLSVTADKLYQWHKQGVEISWIPYFNDTEKAFAVAVDCVVVIDGPRKALAMNFLNNYMNPENNGFMCASFGLPPSNKYAQMNPDIIPFNPTQEDIINYGRIGDLDWKSSHINEWTTIWDEEIQPIIGTGP